MYKTNQNSLSLVKADYFQLNDTFKCVIP